ncbi:MAG: flagellar basal body rod protein FlgC [Oligoflexia bacterium]|nr:flagellar basal body rod protein FlgC [Oligoflexia bacterium]
MSFLTSMDVSASGLNAQRTRLNAISSNLANINTTRTPEGGPYRRKDVVFGAIPERESFSDALDDAVENNFHRVQVMDVVSDPNAPRMVWNPRHPDANQDGYVAMPNINYTEEMVNMLQAQRSYEANVTAYNAAKRMALKALDIGNR